jgi:hypothetical protein
MKRDEAGFEGGEQFLPDFGHDNGTITGQTSREEGDEPHWRMSQINQISRP